MFSNFGYLYIAGITTGTKAHPIPTFNRRLVLVDMIIMKLTGLVGFIIKLKRDGVPLEFNSWLLGNRRVWSFSERLN